MNIPVRFVSLQELDLFQSDEIFLTSTLQGVVPVTTIDTECIGNGKPGPITRRLQKAFEATRR
jgi:branched-subunit amino acid aminotransferase/4-amino-4-deoxychorismate lyase